MDRIFHARIPLYMYFFIALTGGMALFFFWNWMPLCGLFMLLLLIIGIERVIHTTYTLTAQGMLVVSHGRFQRKKTISFKEIRRVERYRVFLSGRSCLLEYLLVCYGDEKHVMVMPLNEEEFVETLRKRMNL